MAQDSSFDVVSKLDLQEVRNALDQTTREIQQRFDFKGSKTHIDLEEGSLSVLTEDEFRLKQVRDILEGKLVKRKVDLKALDWGTPQPAGGGMVRVAVTLANGIPTETAREIVKKIKAEKLKVQVAIQGDQVRVSGKSKDVLQDVIQLLRGEDFGVPLQFTNYR